MIARVLLTGALAIAISGEPASPEPQAAAQSGRVSGTVKLTMANSGKSSARAYDTRSVAPRARPLPEARNVIIFFDDIPASADLAPMKAAIAQKDEQFVPHVVAVTRGSSVSFPNDDPFFHNVFSLSRGANFNLGRYPSGSTRARVFTRPGLVKVFCELHSHMSAVIRVFDHPWFTIPDDQGAFSLGGIPTGEHTLVAWHERIGEQRARVAIRADQVAEVSFTLPVLEAEK